MNCTELLRSYASVRPAEKRISVSRSLLARCLLGGFLVTSLSACISINRASSPENVYSSKASEARSLQVPPDLTNISNGEQFILPGTDNGALARNRLLPEFSSARYVRQGEQNWLEIERTPEELWPRLLAFASSQQYAIDQTEPVAGVIVTQWRSTGGNSGLLGNLINSNDQVFDRVAFRIERSGDAGSRLFARAQEASADEVANLSAPVWPSSSHDPEQVASILTRFLVFLGADEQRAQGILSAAQANTILDNAVLQTTTTGTRLLVHRGFEPSFAAVNTALENLSYDITRSDSSAGRINAEVNGQALIVALSAVHISAVTVSIRDAEGKRFPTDEEIRLLADLRAQLI